MYKRVSLTVVFCFFVHCMIVYLHLSWKKAVNETKLVCKRVFAMCRPACIGKNPYRPLGFVRSVSQESLSIWDNRHEIHGERGSGVDGWKERDRKRKRKGRSFPAINPFLICDLQVNECLYSKKYTGCLVSYCHFLQGTMEIYSPQIKCMCYSCLWLRHEVLAVKIQFIVSLKPFSRNQILAWTY